MLRNPIITILLIILLLAVFGASPAWSYSSNGATFRADLSGLTLIIVTVLLLVRRPAAART